MKNTQTKSTWFVLLCLALAGLWTAGCRTREITTEEKALLLTVQDLVAQGVPVGTPTEAGVRYKVRIYPKEYREIEYDYDDERDPDNDAPLIFITEADFYQDDQAAQAGFEGVIEAYLLGADLSRVETAIVEDPALFSGGDEHYHAFIEFEGRRLGNILVARQGLVVYSFLLSGVAIQDSSTLANLVNPKLEAAVQLAMPPP